MEKPDIAVWDMSLYPERSERDGKPASDRYRFVVFDKAGMVEWHKVPKFEEQTREIDGIERVVRVRVGDRNHQPKRWDVTGTGIVTEDGDLVPYKYGISPVDVRNAEKKIGGKPTHVQMGIWYNPVFSEVDGDGGRAVKIVDGKAVILDWTPVDRKKVLQPPYWLNVDIEYFGKNGWREKAYEKSPDPYKNQERPVSRVMEMEEQLRAKEAELLRKTQDVDRLVREKNSGGGSVGGSGVAK